MTEFARSTFFSKILAALAVAMLLSAGSCGGPNPLPAPPVCETAKECAEILKQETTALSCLPYPGDDRKHEYEIYNDHPNREITVRYLERVRHLNDATRPEESISKVVRVLPKQRERLGCEVTAALFDKVDAWSYRVEEACFTDDCAGGPIAAKPIPPEAKRPEGSQCAALCDAGDPLCATQSISISNPAEAQISNALYRFVFEVVSEGDPHSTSMEQLSNALSVAGLNDCSRNPFEVEAGEFDNSGSTCDFISAVAQPKSTSAGTITGFTVRMPGVFEGNASFNSSSTLLSKNNPSGMPSIFFYDGNNQLFSDRVSEIEMDVLSSSEGQITFGTDETYCARVSFDGG